MRSLWYTAYVVSSLTWLLLSYVEWQIPGFVSQVFPTYVVLILAIGTGIGALTTSSRARSLNVIHEVAAIGIGVVLSLLVFHAADAFGAYRLVLAIIALLVPAVLLKALSDDKH